MDWLSFILGTLFGGISSLITLASICCAAYWWAQREGAKARAAMRFDVARRGVMARIPPEGGSSTAPPKLQPAQGGSGTQVAPPDTKTQGIPITKWDDPNVSEPGYAAFVQLIADAEQAKQPPFVADNI